MGRPTLPFLLLAGLLCACAASGPGGAPAPQGARNAQPTAPSPADPLAPPWTVLATSVEGRPIRQAIFGHGPRHVLFVGGIHGDEREGARATVELGAALLAEPGAAERVTLLVIEDLNPDGSEHGTRGNSHGVDLNRNFPAANFEHGHVRGGSVPLSEPESLALFELVTSWKPELVLVAHSWRAAQFVNYDGPARGVAKRFAARSGFGLRESSALDPTPGSLGSWAAERGVSLLTIEYLRGAAPEDAWNATRAALLGALLDP